MSNKLSEVQARMTGVHGLESVVGAMRGIAAARSREARSRLDGIQACARMVGAAIGDALLLAGNHASAASADAPAGGALTIILGAEQGFVGTFNEHVIDAAIGASAASPTEYFMVGDRGNVAAAERGVMIGWSAPMVTHADEVPALADRLANALYRRLEAGRAAQVKIVHAVPNSSAIVEVSQQRLLPFDFDRFSITPGRDAPLVTLAPQRLLERLAQEYVFAQLCEAIMLSFAAENEARMRAMIAARTNVHNTLEQLAGTFRQLRQEEITSEIVELSAGNLAAAAGRRTPRLRRFTSRQFSADKLRQSGSPLQSASKEP
jgi:F-type H+-transporting ATPase subunit gamma